MTEYAVFDIETTGFALHPDSIVEIAIVHVDAGGAITGSWDTLLRPDGDEVGPTYVHGVTREMAEQAPRFSDVAASLYELFADRIPVAHRLPQFDGRFMVSHFGWAGIEAPEFKQGLCTWKHARRHLPLPSHSLSACCAYLDIKLESAHQALADTVATARLLSHFIRSGQRLDGALMPARRVGSVPLVPVGSDFVPRSRLGQVDST